MDKQQTITFLVAFVIVLSVMYVYLTGEKKKSPPPEEYVVESGIFRFIFTDKIYMEVNRNVFQKASNTLSSLILNVKRKIEVDIILKENNGFFPANTAIVSSNEKNLTTHGIIYINTSLWDEIYDNYKVIVIQHELFHVLGVGLKWVISYDDVEGNYISSSRYPLTMEAYTSITGVDNTLGIPVENEGGRGVSSIHWENNDRTFDGVETKGIPNDIMSCTIDSDSVISLLTLKNLEDLGWEINDEEYGEINFDLPRGIEFKKLKNGVKL